MLFIASDLAAVPCCPGGVDLPVVPEAAPVVAAPAAAGSVPSGRGRLRRRLGRVMNLGRGRTSRSKAVFVAACSYERQVSVAGHRKKLIHSLPLRSNL